MATTELTSSAELAVLARVRGRLDKLEPGCRVIGIRAVGTPRWDGPRDVELDGTSVRVVPCASVLAVLDAVSHTEDNLLTVVYTNLHEGDLGDAVLARMHRASLLDADRNTQLKDELDARFLDPRIYRQPWLVDALIALANAGQLGETAASSLSLHRAITLVTTARLGLDPDQADLPALVEAFDNVQIRAEWRALDSLERKKIVEHLAERHGRGITVIAALAEHHDDLLALLLVAQVLTSADENDTRAASALGGYLQVRFTVPRPSRDELASAGAAGVDYAKTARPTRTDQQALIAEHMLEELTAVELVSASPILPRAFTERLASAASDLAADTIDALEAHHQARPNQHRIDRVRAASRLRRWLASTPGQDYATATEGVRHHARELAWVDRAVNQVRAGDSDPRVAQVLNDVGIEAARARADIDIAFAQRLAVMDSTPAAALAVETLLPSCVAPLAADTPVLLIVLDGMSGAVACELIEHIASRHSGWTEITRCDDGGRDSVVAALPTETTFSRTSLFCANLRSGDQSVERATFPKHRFWPSGGATIVHKAGIAGRHGFDLGSDLESAVGIDGDRVVAVVLNAVDDSLAKGRQSHDPGWRPEDVPGLTQLLDRAAASGRVVLLTSDHGHVLEHDAEHRYVPGSAARYRPYDGAPRADEVVIGGPRMLLSEPQAIFAATENVRYGGRAHGYHGGATLAEVAIPLIALMPPGMTTPAGWTPQSLGAPSWWDGSVPAAIIAPIPPGTVRKRAPKAPASQSEGLFDIATTPPTTRGQALVESESFRDTYATVTAGPRPSKTVFIAVIDALIDAGGRLPLGNLASVAGALGRNPRGLVSVMKRVLNRDSYPVLDLVDSGRSVQLNRQLLDEQFPPDETAR